MDLQLHLPHPRQQLAVRVVLPRAAARGPPRGADGAGGSVADGPSSAASAVSRTVSFSRSTTSRDCCSSSRSTASRARAGDERELGRQLDPDRVDVAVADPQQPVLDVVVDVVAPRAPVPALAEELRVALDLLRAPPARDRLEVVEDALVAVVHLVAGLAQPQAQVDVLEGVAEGRRRSRRRARSRRAAPACRRRSRPGSGATC